MKHTSIPFEKLPYSDLFRNYARQADFLKPFYQVYPFDDAEVEKRAAHFRFQGDRKKSAEALAGFNRLFDAPENTLRQISKLEQPETLAVVTGQQLSLYGGPLFTVYKTITAVIYARRWEKLLKRPVIPVFWLADEDHDYTEAGEIGLLKNDKWLHLELGNGRAGLPVGREVLGPNFNSLRKDLCELLPETDFTGAIKQLLDDFYREGVTFRDAFGRWMLKLFSKYGLVLAGSDDQTIKKLISAPLVAAAVNHDNLFVNLDDQSTKLEKTGFSRQALVRNSNIFYIDPDHGRQKLDIRDGRWMTGNGKAWSIPELESEIEKHPEHFSPNVFLRPIMQDLLVPTLAYVSGPGELSYYAQMKSAYEWMGQEMPMLIPRFSLTLKEPAINRIFKELPFEFHEYSQRIEDLESLYLKRTATHDVESLFSTWSASVEKLTETKKKEIEKIDPTLMASADKAGTVFQNELDKLKGKTYRSVKKQDKVQLKRIRRIRENLFPDGDLQERKIVFIYYMVKYGPDVWDRLLETLQNEIPDSHKIVYL